MLGSAFAKAASRRKHGVIGIVGSFSGQIDGLESKRKIDLLDRFATERKVLEVFPDVIVNCAAFSYPSRCEEEPEKSNRLNVELPAQLASLAKHLFAKFIHISSEQVFDGHNPPYRRTDSVSVINHYAKQKVDSEQRVHEIAAEFATTLRVPLLSGNSPSGNRSLHERLLRDWSQGKETPLFTDERRQVCLVDNLADVLVELCERNDLKGIYHWAGSESLSRYDMGTKIAERFGLSTELIVSAKRDDQAWAANRQPDLSMDLEPLKGLLKTSPQTFDQQLESLIVPVQLRAWYNSI